MISDASSTPPFPETSTQPAPWLDLALYLGVGLGLFFLASLAFRGIFEQTSIFASAILYLVNISVFAGTVLLVGVARGRLTLAGLGLWPPRLRMEWLLAAGGLAILLIPVRVGLALAVQLAVSGDLGDLADTQRLDVFSPGGPIWLSFLVTFVLGGLIVPIAEELYFRGALFTWFRRRFNFPVAMLASGVLFALGHADMLAVVVTSFIIGLVNAWLFERTRSLWVPIAVHVVNNSLAIALLYAALAVQQSLGM